MATVSTGIQSPVHRVQPESRIVFTQGGKGGVGKTAFCTLLVEWYGTRNAPVVVIDMDNENKRTGSVSHFYPDARKVNIQRDRGLDGFLDVLEEGAAIVVADMGAGAGEVAQQWFEAMHGQVADIGVAFTAIGIVTPDPASVSSVLTWADFLEDRVDYVIVKNAISHHADFSYWDNDEDAAAFRAEFKPRVISMEYRLAEIEHPAREHGVTMQAVAERKTTIPELSSISSRLRAQGYRRNLFAELNRIGDLLLL